ncbi:redox-sensitive bicupin YhaK (pirin superfamily) [Microbacterium trichothecenolyticum]|uniref:pirin family protein n=1 Tax=Microbacterium trichothecenolyticum TaxID=69370 RepID=UPI0028642443|nr:pirin family protein [Microbacterium trichothecenolyticum]MDR7110786.1 redox-sensitive bicupin YhaK (pirin superfamily) [Microbacterium trichothecenolyticum]
MTRMDADDAVATESAVECAGPRTLLLEAREVPLGGVRAMSVHRALPQRELPLVGAWCFLDRFGPQETRMRVEPHPHIGLQTVTWPYLGDVRHRDSVGSDVVVRRGALNLMTSGAGIAHSEYSVGEDAAPLDALQLWVALPESRRHGGPAFEQHAVLPEVELAPVTGDAGSATVVLGELAGVASPATVYTPIVGAELRIPAGSTVTVPLDPAWEHALVAVYGQAAVAADAGDDVVVDAAHLLYLGTHRDDVVISSPAGATLFLLGGEPFEDDVVMWWNFVGRTHEEIVEAREAWEAGSDRFGRVVDHGDERIPAPPMPAVRLTRRRRRL